ncbi:MAG: shikimate dehydrogenase, partial [Pseudomonadota bacterium]
MTAPLKLGLIGDAISTSSAPRLHRLAGELLGVDVSYDLLVPAAQDKSFEALFDWARAQGYAGLNITYPYKERVLRLAQASTDALTALGAFNTIRFEDGGPLGFNTDHSGFLSAYRAAFSDAGPGIVCLIGCGGVGRAIAFALAELGVQRIRLVDLDPARADRLAADLRSVFPALGIAKNMGPEAAVEGASGLVNATAIGMEGRGGQVLTASQMAGADWAFDAVYTPVDTGFLRSAHSAGL